MGSLGFSIAKKKAMWLYPRVIGFNPSERWGHSACYFQGNMYIFGGCCGGMHFSDVLVLNLDTMVWTVMATTGQGPGPRDSHSAVLVGNKMIIFGGTNGSKKVNDLHMLDLRTKEWTQPECKGNPPSPRESHTATLVGDDKLVTFGGSGEGESNYLNDLHVLDLKAMRWTKTAAMGEIPVPRDSHSAVAVGNKLLLYGGDCGDRYHGDVDMLDLNSLTWSRLAVHGSSPGVRAGHAAVNIGTKVYVTGGVGDKHYYNDTWILDVSTCSWNRLDICGQQPQGRFSHTALVTDSDIVIYGGCGEDERPLNDLLVLQLGAEHPNGRYNISMCKIFGKHWNQDRTSLRGEDRRSTNLITGNDAELVRKGVHELESEKRQSSVFLAEISHPKKRRTLNPKVWEVESEQEEHSLSLSQNSSPSQSDQEQTPIRKATNSVSSSQGFHFLKHLNQNLPNNISSNQKELRDTIPQDLNFLGPQSQLKQEQHLLNTVHNPIGAEVRGRVDGAFDSGLLMTATINGKIFRGVLFPPGAGIFSRGTIVAQNSSLANSQAPVSHHHLFPNLNNAERLFKHPQKQATANTMPESSPSFRQTPVGRPLPLIRATSSPLSKEPKLRSDLQGVFLTLGGPGGISGGP